MTLVARIIRRLMSPAARATSACTVFIDPHYNGNTCTQECFTTVTNASSIDLGCGQLAGTIDHGDQGCSELAGTVDPGDQGCSELTGTVDPGKPRLQ